MKSISLKKNGKNIFTIQNSYEDSYNGDFTTRRAVIYTLNFTAKTYLFGPMSNSGVIKTVQSDIYTDTNTTTAKREERIQMAKLTDFILIGEMQ